MSKVIRLFVFVVASLIFGMQPASAAGDIVLGPGDVLKISVFEQPDLSLDVRVSEAGTITFPLIGEVVVAGDTTAGAERKIASKLESGGFLKRPHVNIIVAQLQSQQVSVLGQVNRPGRYPLDSARSVAEFLALAGGINPDGGDLITLVRTQDGQVVREELDFGEVMRTGDLAKNINLSTGDIVYVERSPKFYIYGEVQRPGQYRLEHGMTVIQGLSQGGGLTPRGTERNVRIKRRDEAGVLHVIKVQHEDLIKTNDVIYVQESLF